ncbi:MAG: transglycosylase domain-containing protein [Pseudomonadota bacterium]
MEENTRNISLPGLKNRHAPPRQRLRQRFGTPGVRFAVRMSVILVLAFTGALFALTVRDIKKFPAPCLSPGPDGTGKPRVLDRNGIPLSISYLDSWNLDCQVPLHAIPARLRQAFVLSEDKRFFSHHGPDWLARIHALWQNLRAFKNLRGASTITEQVVRLIHPRSRTVRSRWLEGIEAAILEGLHTKDEILEFYLNQVPYAANRRGVLQASLYYFDRDLTTLSSREMLALAILVRAPSSFDLYKNPHGLDSSLNRLATAMVLEGYLTHDEADAVRTQDFVLSRSRLPVMAPGFIRYVRFQGRDSAALTGTGIRTTLDSHIQEKVQAILDQALSRLAPSSVHNGAALVTDHRHGEILAWVTGHPEPDQDPSGTGFDAVRVPRQPGSSLKPFLYALALEKGWTAASLIDDAPLAEKVGTGGLHAYRNYSRIHYGPVTVRQALGNSLNIPAVKTIQFTGINTFLETLKQLGITSLDLHPDHYGDGLALGNGEISLLELVQAYAVLANRGTRISLSPVFTPGNPVKVFSPQITAIISNILSDPEARTLEFGSNSILNFPVQTAVKTGTSSDHRDAWAAGYTSRFTAGVWMGNLDGTPTLGLTGSRGPVMVLRSIMAELNSFGETAPLHMDPALVSADIRLPQGPGRDGPGQVRTEWFVPGTQPGSPATQTAAPEPFGFLTPVNGMTIARDPRIPDDHEGIDFLLSGILPGDTITWTVDGTPAGVTHRGRLPWSIKPGDHSVQVCVVRPATGEPLSDTVHFTVR